MGAPAGAQVLKAAVVAEASGVGVLLSVRAAGGALGDEAEGGTTPCLGVSRQRFCEMNRPSGRCLAASKGPS